MITYKVKQNAKGGVTIMAQLAKKGAWKKVRKFATVEHGIFWTELSNLLHAEDADAQLTALLTQYPKIKMKVSNEECIATMLKEEAHFILTNFTTATPAVVATPTVVEKKTPNSVVKTQKKRKAYTLLSVAQKIEKAEAKAARSAAYKLRCVARAARHAARAARRLAKHSLVSE